jgi:citrate synthase
MRKHARTVALLVPVWNYTDTAKQCEQVMARDGEGSGLEEVVVADTTVSCIDGERGHFSIRGRDIDALCGSFTFEEVCALLWHDAVGAQASRNVHSSLAEGRAAAFALVSTLTAALSLTDSMDALRAAMCHLRLTDRDRTRAQLTGAVAVFAAAWKRIRDGNAPIAPRRHAAHAADYLYMLDGTDPSSEQAATLDAYLVTMAEHDFMPSTFAARVIASTNADVLSAIVGALGALKGSAHGGAPAPVLAMIRAIGVPERAEEWVRAQIDSGQRIMGMGHRVYRTRDPRATALEGILENLEVRGRHVEGLGVARAVENAAQRMFAERRPQNRIAANVELFAAVLLNHVGLEPDLFTPTYAVSCVSGWLAHYDEQVMTGRLIRPRSRYVGRA